MKKIFLLLLLILSSIVTFSQRLNFFDVVKLCNSDIDGTDSFLSRRGFSFIGLEDDSTSKIATWAHKPTQDNLSNCFFSIKIPYKSEAYVTYNLLLTSRNEYDSLKMQVKESGYLLIDSRVIKHGILSIYEGKKHSISFLSREGDDNVYQITIRNLLAHEMKHYSNESFFYPQKIFDFLNASSENNIKYFLSKKGFKFSRIKSGETFESHYFKRSADSVELGYYSNKLKRFSYYSNSPETINELHKSLKNGKIKKLNKEEFEKVFDECFIYEDDIVVCVSYPQKGTSEYYFISFMAPFSH